MVSSVEIAKCFFSLSCSLMISIFISLAIQATITFSSDVCGADNELETGVQKCVFTERRIWSLAIFYSAAVVFIIGTLGSCQSNGWIIITYMIAFVTLLGVMAGLVIQRMMSDDIEVTKAVDTITYEIIRDKWGLYATILRWIILIGPITAFSTGSFLVYYFLAYKNI